MRSRTPNRCRSPGREGGSASFLVILLMLIMTTFVIANAVVLEHLRQDLRRIDRQQAAHWAKQAGVPMKSSPARR